MPRKIASVKNANPSSENGIPMMGPANRMNSGHNSPSSNDSTVPDTAPTANRIAVAGAGRCPAQTASVREGAPAPSAAWFCRPPSQKPLSAGYAFFANGTVSSAEFYSAGSPHVEKRYKYAFTYDALQRLMSADYSGWSGSA